MEHNGTFNWLWHAAERISFPRINLKVITFKSPHDAMQTKRSQAHPSTKNQFWAHMPQLHIEFIMLVVAFAAYFRTFLKSLLIPMDSVLFTFAWSVPIDCFIKFIQRRGEGCRGLMRTLINTSLTRFVHTSLKILKVDGRLCYLVRLRSRIRAFARHQVLSGAFAAWCFRPANVFP